MREQSGLLMEIYAWKDAAWIMQGFYGEIEGASDWLHIETHINLKNIKALIEFWIFWGKSFNFPFRV